MTIASEHYRLLFSKLESDLGEVCPETLTAIIGFSAGGPVSMRRVGSKHAYVTCELSLCPEQRPSSEGETFELLSCIQVTESQLHALLTALGNYSLEAELGHGHSVNVAGVSGAGGLALVWLRHYSSASIGGKRYGVYEVVSGQPNEA
jgi:hypothetical protein